MIFSDKLWIIINSIQPYWKCSQYTIVPLNFWVIKYLFISDFLKGIELLLLGCLKVVLYMHTSSWSVAERQLEPWRICLTSFHSLKPDPSWPTISDGYQGGTFLKKTIIRGWVDFQIYMAQKLRLYIPWYTYKFKSVSFIVAVPPYTFIGPVGSALSLETDPWVYWVSISSVLGWVFSICLPIK